MLAGMKYFKKEKEDCEYCCGRTVPETFFFQAAPGGRLKYSICRLKLSPWWL